MSDPHTLLAPGQQSSAHYRGATLDTGIPVRAVNNSDAPITWMYDRVKYTLAPGVPSFIPYLCMVLYQGDPRAIDLPGRPEHEQYRRNEYARLRIFCGVYEDDTNWETCPHVHVTCYPIDSDIPFNTVLRDPTGEAMSEQAGATNELEFMKKAMEEQASSLRILQAQVAARESADQARAIADFDPNDLDSQVTTSKAISPEEATGQSMLGAHPVQKSKAAKARPAPGEGPAVTKDA